MTNPIPLFLWSLALLATLSATAQELGVAELQDFSKRNADFAARLYRAVASRTDDNILLSPLAVSTGLAAVMSGAEGTTLEQLLQGLSLVSLDPVKVPDLFQSLKSTITQSGAFPLSQGIAVLPAQKFTVSSAYTDLVQTKYGGKVQSLAFTSPQEARDTINTWAQGQTGDQVRDLVSALDAQTQMLLVTAAHYQSQFALAFNASFTQDERFYVDKYRIVQVPMMFRSDKYYLAYDGSLKLGILKLPMSDGTAMLVLLPDENVDITSIDEEISAERFHGWVKQLKKTKLEVQLPRFQLEQTYSLQNILPGLGINEVFQDTADLSTIGDTGLKLTEVLHKACMTVDETSNTASGDRVTTFSSLPPRLTINRPFLFIIYHEQTSSVLYMGRVVNPTKK